LCLIFFFFIIFTASSFTVIFKITIDVKISDNRARNF